MRLLESTVDGQQVKGLPRGDSLEEQVQPLVRICSFDPDCEGFSIPVGNVEVRLLQREDVDELVTQHPCPIEGFRGGMRRCERDDQARRSANRLDPRQADHAGTEPLMGTVTLGGSIDFDLRLPWWLEPELAGQLGVDALEIVRHRLTEKPLVFRNPDEKVCRLDRDVTVENLHHLAHVMHADVIGIGLEC